MDRGSCAKISVLEVICLKEGTHELPKNVRVYSLGKERAAASRGAYAFRFLSLAWRLRGEYDAVFVHMNQEYVLIAGWLWKLLGKKIYLWRNHYAGSLATNIAALFCTKVFYTSKHSYTARFKNAMKMPVGVDTARFYPDPAIAAKPRSILFFGRMAKSKRPELLIDALAILKKEGEAFSATFCGSPLTANEAYYETLKEKVRARNLTHEISFVPAVPNSEAPDLYRAHAIFVNCSPSGMFDKTLFEAAACGCFVLATSDDFAGLAGEEHHFSSAEELAKRLGTMLAGPAVPPSPFVADTSLTALTTAFAKQII